MSVLGQSFTVAGVAVQLLSVQDVSPDQAGSENAFVLMFASADGTLDQGLPEFSHPQFGTFPLMVVPGVLDSDGQHYTAVFNRTHG